MGEESYLGIAKHRRFLGGRIFETSRSTKPFLYYIIDTTIANKKKTKKHSKYN